MVINMHGLQIPPNLQQLYYSPLPNFDTLILVISVIAKNDYTDKYCFRTKLSICCISMVFFVFVFFNLRLFVLTLLL